MRKGVDIGTAVGLQVTALGIGAGALVGSAHAAGMEAMRRAHEHHVLAAQDIAVADFRRAARIMAAELAAAHAQNVRLKRALAQRQAFIDRLRRSS